MACPLRITLDRGCRLSLAHNCHLTLTNGPIISMEIFCLFSDSIDSQPIYSFLGVIIYQAGLFVFICVVYRC
jgi:hypothetical protein